MIGDQNTKMLAAQEAAQVGGISGAMMHAMEMLPTPGAMAGFNNFRYQQTMLKGGFYDDALLSRGKVGKALGRSKHRIFDGSMKPTGLEAKSFAFGSKFGQPTKRGKKLLAKAAASTSGSPFAAAGAASHATYGMAGGFRANYANPLHWFSGRMHSTSVFGAGSHSNFYAPVAGGFLATTGNQAVNGARALKRFAGGGTLKRPVGEKSVNYFNGGMIGRLGAVRRSESMSAKKLSRMNLNLSRVMSMNNPSLSSGIMRSGSLAGLGRDTGHLIGMGGSTPAERLAIGRSMATSNTGQVGAYRSLMGMEGAVPVTNGIRRYATTEGMTGKYTKSFTQSILTSGGGVEMRTMMGTAGTTMFGGVETQMSKSFEKIARPLATALQNNGALTARAVEGGIQGARSLIPYASTEAKLIAERMSQQIVEKGLVKTLGVKGAISAAKGGGARVGLAVAGEIGLAAIPGVNLVFAADLAYNLAKLAGAGVKAGINFGKDGIKSMTGTMNNGLFGNGYKDNEVAATSRSRGVAAIQNSRLNARSLLGSEGAMMHAHFG